MTKRRKQLLQRNLPKLFVVKAFLYLRMLNIVLSIFYVHRGISVSDILYLSIIWAVSALLVEVPSSYLADHWGRKKTLVLGVFLAFLQWVVMLHAHSFGMFALATALYGAHFAMISGTDNALLYDTKKELGHERRTLGALGKFRSAQSIFKIVTPIIGAFIAQDLVEWQFSLLISLDALAALVAMIVALSITEPAHKMDVQKMEAGVMVDAISLLKKDPYALKAMLSNEIIFYAFFLPWTYYQKFYTDAGLSILTLGISWSALHMYIFLWNWFVGKLHTSKHVGASIDAINMYFASFSVILLAALFILKIPWVSFSLFIITTGIASMRHALFAELFNKRFLSYNRATTLSLTNVLHNVIQIPLAFVGGIIVAYDLRYPYVLAFLMALCVVFFLRLGKEPATS